MDDAALFAEDLALAQAAARGEARAVRRIVDEVIPAACRAVQRVDASPAFIDEVRQALRVHLLVGDAVAAPRIAAYSGRGPLAAWVRVAALRLALNAKRAEAPARALPIEDLLGEVALAGPDAGLAHLRSLYRAPLAEALRDALAALPERQRALLRLHHVDGLRLAEIAGLYRVHESTASRWLQAAADAVATSARARLEARLGLGASDFDSIVRLLQSQLELSISRLLS
jgi:RNA polymerase sigma-70 factor (ECF subfamily)